MADGVAVSAIGIVVGALNGASVADGATIGAAGMRDGAVVGVDVGAVVGESVVGDSVRLLTVGAADNSPFDMDGESDGRGAVEGLDDNISVGCPVIEGTPNNVGSVPPPIGFGLVVG